jgi:hypothetical protein
MKKYFLLLLFASSLSAQTITPLIAEYGKKASGSFTITNNGLKPLNVVLEKHGFDVTKNGDAVLTPLPAGVDVELGATSTVIGIQQSHTFYYKISCSILPCKAELLALMSTGERTSQGLQMSLGLPHVIYLCQVKKNCRLDTLKSYGYDPTLAAKK